MSILMDGMEADGLLPGWNFVARRPNGEILHCVGVAVSAERFLARALVTGSEVVFDRVDGIEIEALDPRQTAVIDFGAPQLAKELWSGLSAIDRRRSEGRSTDLEDGPNSMLTTAEWNIVREADAAIVESQLNPQLLPTAKTLMERVQNRSLEMSARSDATVLLGGLPRPAVLSFLTDLASSDSTPAPLLVSAATALAGLRIHANCIDISEIFRQVAPTAKAELSSRLCWYSNVLRSAEIIVMFDSDRECADIDVGDIFHGRRPNGAALICRAMEVTEERIAARRVGYLGPPATLSFSRCDGIELGTPESGGGIIASAAKLPNALERTLIDVDQRIRTLEERRRIDPEAKPRDLTYREQIAGSRADRIFATLSLESEPPDLAVRLMDRIGNISSDLDSRVQAITALGRYPNVAVRDFLIGCASDLGMPASMQLEAARSLFGIWMHRDGDLDVSAAERFAETARIEFNKIHQDLGRVGPAFRTRLI